MMMGSHRARLGRATLGQVSFESAALLALVAVVGAAGFAALGAAGATAISGEANRGKPGDASAEDAASRVGDAHATKHAQGSAPAPVAQAGLASVMARLKSPGRMGRLHGALRRAFTPEARSRAAAGAARALTAEEIAYAGGYRHVLRLLDFDPAIAGDVRTQVADRLVRMVPAEQLAYMDEVAMRVRILPEGARRSPGLTLELTPREVLSARHAELLDALGRYEGAARRALAERVLDHRVGSGGNRAALDREAGLLLNERLVRTLEQAGERLRVVPHAETKGRVLALAPDQRGMLLSGDALARGLSPGEISGARSVLGLFEEKLERDLAARMSPAGDGATAARQGLPQAAPEALTYADTLGPRARLRDAAAMPSPTQFVYGDLVEARRALRE